MRWNPKMRTKINESEQVAERVASSDASKLQRNFRAAIDDIIEGAKRYELWMALSHDDVRLRFKRTLLGVLWITASYLVFVAAKTIIFGAISPQPAGWFLLYVASGFLAWTFLSGSVVDACNVFVNAENWILGIKMPLSLYIFQNIFRELIFFLYSSIVAIGAFAFLRPSHFFDIIWVIPSLVVFVINAAFVNMYLGPLCARFRDFTQIIQTSLKVLFFLTPLVWTPEQVGDIAGLLWWNPFMYFVDIFRAPLVEGYVPIFSWLVVGSITIFNVISGSCAFAWSRSRIPYWL
jgi:ABC-2 type transport system permease protein